MHPTEIEGYRKILDFGNPLSITACKKLLRTIEELQAEKAETDEALQRLLKKARR